MNPSIYLAIPARDEIHTDFAVCLFGLCSNAANRITGTAFLRGTCLSNQRQRGVKQALSSKTCTHILFLDSDMLFPPNVGERLLAHNAPIVGVDYRTRVAPHRRTACDANHNAYTTTSGVHPVANIGTGILLISLSVFTDMSIPFFPHLIHNGTITTEDIGFCSKVNTPILCDFDLSKEVSHLAVKPISLLD